MGRSSSKLIEKPNNPLQELEYKESQRERQRKREEKQKKQIARLQKKQMKKQKTKRKKKSESLEEMRELDRQSSLARHEIINYPAGLDRPVMITASSSYKKDDYQRQLELKIQKQLNEDLCGFLLNQSVLQMQFYKNYESELYAIPDELLSKEKELNQNLEEHSILLANPLDAALAKWIRYKPMHGPDKNHCQLLQTQTMYVVFENVDIARPNDANYDSITPLCKVNMECDFRETTPCKEDYVQMLNDIKWKGYVRLKMQEDAKQRPAEDVADIYSEASSGYGTCSSPYSSKKEIRSNFSASNDDYDYAFITHLNTNHPLKELKMSNALDQQRLEAKVLPDSCVSTLENFVELLPDEFSDDEDEEESDDEAASEYGGTDYRDYDTLQAIKLYRIELEKRRQLLAQNYLNSREFMRYFGELVRRKLAAQLGITQDDLDTATYRATAIYTSEYEIIPAIHVAQNVLEWPKCAFEFRLRERPVCVNPQTGQEIQWPTRAMLKRIETFGFHLIPMGYAPKKQRNPFRDLEWRLVFPKAERYLEQHLTNAQVKVFMMTKALFKSFVEPLEKNKALMFAFDHLRMHLFWECERDYTAWPEEFLGDVLIRFISTFMQRLREKKLKDYFISERNLFESIPEYSLVSLYSILADIVANPSMHLMIALRNLDYQHGDKFFPKLNLKKLYDNLIVNDIIKLKMLAKNARSLADLGDPDEEESGPCLMQDEEAKGLLGLKQHHVRTAGKLRRKTHLLRHNMELKKLEMQAKRKSTESIDVEYFFQNNLRLHGARQINQGLENLRRTNVLEIILDHLLDMAERSIAYKCVTNSKLYLSQARRLCKCYHNYGCDMGAKEYLARIHGLDEELLIIYDQEDFSAGAPNLPRRFSMEPYNTASAVDEKSVANGDDSFNLYAQLDSFENDLDEPRDLCTISESIGDAASCSAVTTPASRKSLRFADASSSDAHLRKSFRFSSSEDYASDCLSSPAVSSPESRKSIRFVESERLENLGALRSPESRKSIRFQESDCSKNLDALSSPESRKSIRFKESERLENLGALSSPESRKSIRFQENFNSEHLTSPLGALRSPESRKSIRFQESDCSKNLDALSSPESRKSIRFEENLKNLNHSMGVLSSPESRKSLKFMENDSSENLSALSSPESRKSIRFHESGNSEYLNNSMGSIRSPESRKSIRFQENRGDNLKSPESRKSIKFKEIVVEVHEGDANPLLKANAVTSPQIGILRKKSTKNQRELVGREIEDDSEVESIKSIGILRSKSKAEPQNLNEIKGNTQEISTEPKAQVNSCTNQEDSISIIKRKSSRNQREYKANEFADKSKETQNEFNDEEETKETLNTENRKKSTILQCQIEEYLNSKTSRTSKEAKECAELGEPIKESAELSEPIKEFAELSKATKESSQLSEAVKQSTIENNDNLPTSLPKKDTTELSSFLKTKWKSTSDFIKSSPLGSSEILQDLTQNSQKLLSQMTAEEKRAQIRQMLKKKTFQLKGALIQSSDT